MLASHNDTHTPAPTPGPANIKVPNTFGPNTWCCSTRPSVLSAHRGIPTQSMAQEEPLCKDFFNLMIVGLLRMLCRGLHVHVAMSPTHVKRWVVQPRASGHLKHICVVQGPIGTPQANTGKIVFGPVQK